MVFRLLVFGLPATAGKGSIGFPITRAEFMFLPAYCRAHIGATKFRYYGDVDPSINVPMSEWKMWMARLGPNVVAIHHLCSAHVLAVRARNPSSRAVRRSRFPQEFANRAVAEFEYWISHQPKNGNASLVLTVKLNLAEAYQLKGNYESAEMVYTKALKSSPENGKIYVDYARMLSKRETNRRQWNCCSMAKRKPRTRMRSFLRSQTGISVVAIWNGRGFISQRRRPQASTYPG